MSKTLFLLRHARASDRLIGQKDFDRELDSIGLQNSTRMGINFSHKAVHFDMIMSSPAMRAKQTASLVSEQIKYDTKKIHLNEEIYEASVRTLLQVINRLKDEWTTVLIVAHNPSISYLAEYLTGSEIGDMTTCGVCHLEFETESWAEVSEGTGELITYEYPDLLNF
ncbi:histidine phosphatase family protein [Fulvivirga sp. RKSG066]|uniref:SixA phosphatase family protein n=1 Tax=Fulvivirga aurantia TaxID=2529383 RepID=UPI0012BD64F4|nr:histidine phosphatase family protein [Fulvivirga aurantia]MTI21024.1 histidine phosphatase family protein [Fulvivirga aurantia]